MKQAGRVRTRDLVRYMRGHALAMSLAAVLSLVAAGGTLLQPVLVRSVIDAISASRSTVASTVALVSLLVGAAVANGFRDYMLRRVGEGVVLRIRQRLAGHVLRLPVAEYDSRRTGDLLSRIGSDSSMLRSVVTSGLFEIFTGTLMIIGAAVAAFLVDPLLFAVTAGGLLTGLAGAAAIAHRTRPASEEAQMLLGEMTSGLERAIRGVRTIRAARGEQRETEAIVDSARRAYGMGLRLARLQAFTVPVAHIATQGVFLLVLGVGGARVAAGGLSVGDLVAFVLFLFFLIMPVGQLIGAYSQLQTGLGALQRIEDVLRVPTETDGDVVRVQPPREGRGATPVFGAGSVPALAFDRVTFGYGTGETVVEDISFTVSQGTRTALVGPSGAGKSTLLALAERFYDVRSGAIRLCGADIRQVSRDELRSRLGYVEQEAPILAGTLRENLSLSAPGLSDDELTDVLNRVNLDEIVKRSPLGLDAQVGEGGVLLSGGERQRLAIARTLLAAPSILLLDEPTSNLDARNEQAFRAAIDAVPTDHTLLIVAHRLATVVDADQIVVVDHGRVVGMGTHHELIESSALYRDLASHQLLVA